MTCKIRVLDEKTINQIAAGEVIENPASVIKELVDNALDAKATKIQVVATNSGRQSIRVQDDGVGMSHDDALLSIERHATSKIRTIDDLFHIGSMGFRGEALSSIASVSEMRLLTAPNNGVNALVAGTCVTVHGGKILSHQRVDCLGGTDIEVSSLFYNVPARKKFLKSPAKDASDIIKTIMQLALAHPSVSFELVVNQEKIFSLAPQSLSDRIKATLGNEFYQHLIAVRYKSDQLEIEGYIANPSYSRPTRTSQYLFVNNRPVHSLFVSSVVKEAYGTALDSTRHPAFVLSLRLKQELLDVNVHPQKREVRFSSEEIIKNGLLDSVSKALFTQKPAPVVAQREFGMAQQRQEFSYSTPHQEFQQIIRPVPLEIVQPPLIPLKPEWQVQGIFQEFLFVEIEWRDREVPQELQGEGIYLISLSHALSRIAYDGAESAVESSKILAQALLVPLFLELTPPEAVRLKERLPEFAKAGLQLREFGIASFLVESIPNYLEVVDVEEAIRQLVSEDSTPSVPEALAKIAATGKRKVVFTKEIGEQIVKKLLACKNPFVSPFGARIISLLTAKELEKKFCGRLDL